VTNQPYHRIQFGFFRERIAALARKLNFSAEKPYFGVIASNRNEYQECFLGVKATGAQG
jgi:long-subunit acyl-CoA synthetase (AMP-forming)